MAQTRVIGDRKQGNLDDLFRRAGRDKKIKEIIEGKKEKPAGNVEKADLLDLMGLTELEDLKMGYSDVREYPFMQRMIACYDEGLPIIVDGKRITGGWLLCYYSGFDSNEKIRLAYDRCGLEAGHDVFPIPDRTSKLSVMRYYHCNGEYDSKKELPGLAPHLNEFIYVGNAINDLAHFNIIEVSYNDEGEIKHTIGFFLKEDSDLFIANYMYFNGSLDFSNPMPAPEKINAITVLEPEYEFH